MNYSNTNVFFKMKNVIQHYPWGSVTSFSQLFGYENPIHQPQAEIWMGAHPNGCSLITVDGSECLLSDLINDSADEVLSNRVSMTFKQLPFLFKVLAADSALSIQVHPSKDEAESGFYLENQKGIALNAYERNYKDCNHKPEFVYALTSYKAMNGFRQYEDIDELLSYFTVNPIKVLAHEFSENRTATGLAILFKGVLSLKAEQLRQSLQELHNIAVRNKENPTFATVLELLEQHQYDVGILACLLLNVITLKPGEAMYLDPRTPHAYLKGTALEVMANSDNVIRAGLTNKHVDINELIRCTSFTEKKKSELIIKPIINGDEYRYPIPVKDFSFSLYTKVDEKLVEVISAEILMPIDDDLILTHENGNEIIIKKGRSVFIPAYAQRYTMLSNGRVARVYC